MTAKPNTVKKKVFEFISKAEEGDWASRLFDWSIMALIALSIVSIVLESFPGIYVRWHPTLQVFETVTVAVFTIEYFLRIWTADLLFPGEKHPYLRYVFSFMAVIDLLAILPFYLPFISADLRFLRMMRLFRLFRLLRVLKLGRYFDALQHIMRVIRASLPQLVVSVVICFFVVLFSSIIMYTVEYPVQPQQFPNVIASLWWAICTLTTVGYGDVYPITHIGRFFAALISLVGVGIIAIPTGIIAAGFNQMLYKEDAGEEAAPTAAEVRVEKMTEEELLLLQAKVARRLRGYGYSSVLSLDGKKEAAPGPGQAD